jgi:hypothetical protein
MEQEPLKVEGQISVEDYARRSLALPRLGLEQADSGRAFLFLLGLVVQPLIRVPPSSLPSRPPS